MSFLKKSTLSPRAVKGLEDVGMEKVKPFIGVSFSEHICAHTIHLVGICFDGTTSFRPGARFGPDAIRDVSFNLETFSPYLDRDLEDRSLLDLGNLPFFSAKPERQFENFYKMTQGISLKEDGIRLVTLGGEHSISFAPIDLHLKQYPDLLLVHLDAHADLRDGYLDEPYSHASIIRRVLDQFGPQHQLVQYGIRSGTKEEFEFMRREKTLFTSLESFCQFLQSVNEDRPIYLTLDLDFFDPAFLPGTGTPEAGGENFHSFVKIIKILQNKNFVGADIVELAPMLDATHNSSCFASKITREVLLALKF